MAHTNLDLVFYDFDHLPSSGFFLLLGKRGTGKTTYAQWISTFSKYKCSGIFCAIVGSEAVKQAWEKIIPDIYIYDPTMAIEFLRNLRHTQNQAIMDSKAMNIEFSPDLHVTLFMDDVASIPTIMKCPEMAYLASNSRHLQTTIFITSQHIHQIPSQVRGQFDMIMSLATSSMKNIKVLHEEYANGIDSRTFKHIMSVATEDHGIMILDNTKSSTIATEVCFYARIEPYPPRLSRLGHPAMWTFASSHSSDTLRNEIKQLKEVDTLKVDSCMIEDDLDPILDDRRVISDKHGRISIRKLPSLGHGVSSLQVENGTADTTTIPL